MLCLLVALLLPAALAAQSTTADGSIFYFASSLRRTGTQEPIQGRIYTVDASSGLRLYAERTRVPPGEDGLTNYYWLDAPEVSSDGNWVAIRAGRECNAGRRCTGVPLTETTITGPRGAAPVITARGRVRFSPSGRYALAYPVEGIGGNDASLIDLSSGRTVPAGRVSSPGRAGRLPMAARWCGPPTRR